VHQTSEGQYQILHDKQSDDPYQGKGNHHATYSGVKVLQFNYTEEFSIKAVKD
jgi:hypothetical protein